MKNKYWKVYNSHLLRHVAVFDFAKITSPVMKSIQLCGMQRERT